MNRPEPTTRTEAARDAEDYWAMVAQKHPDQQMPRTRQEYIEHVLSRPGMWRVIADRLPPLSD